MIANAWLVYIEKTLMSIIYNINTVRYFNTTSISICVYSFLVIALSLLFVIVLH